MWLFVSHELTVFHFIKKLHTAYKRIYKINISWVHQVLAWFVVVFLAQLGIIARELVFARQDELMCRSHMTTELSTFYNADSFGLMINQRPIKTHLIKLRITK